MCWWINDTHGESVMMIRQSIVQRDVQHRTTVRPITRPVKTGPYDYTSDATYINCSADVCREAWRRDTTGRDVVE